MEADVVQRRARGIGRDVTADTVGSEVRAVHGDRRVPTDDAPDAMFDLAVPRVGWLLVRWDRVDVVRLRRQRWLHAEALRGLGHLVQQIARSIAALVFDDGL